MSDAIEMLKKDIASYENLKRSGKKCLTTNNEECCFVHYPEIKEALLALESQSSRVGQVAFLHQENQLLKKENARLKKVDRFVIEVFNRLKERAEFDRARAETDLKILEKWKKNYLELEK